MKNKNQGFCFVLLSPCTNFANKNVKKEKEYGDHLVPIPYLRACAQ